MILTTLLVAALQTAAPAAPPEQAPALPPQAAAEFSLEQRAALRCAAAFALAAEAQSRGDPQALALPPLAERGREYFVRLSAAIMDDTGQPRDAIAANLLAEAQGLVQRGERYAAVPPCLILLDAAGL